MARKPAGPAPAPWYALWFWMRPLGGGPAKWCSVYDTADRDVLEEMAAPQRAKGGRVKITVCRPPSQRERFHLAIAT